MDIESLRLALNEPSLLGLGVAFTAGFLFSINTVAIAAIPVTLAYVTKAHAPRRALLLGGAFVAGLLATHIVLGVAAALGGEWVKNAMGREWGLALGPVLIVLGLMQAGRGRRAPGGAEGAARRAGAVDQSLFGWRQELWHY